jgi:hypothetical protein
LRRSFSLSRMPSNPSIKSGWLVVSSVSGFMLSFFANVEHVGRGTPRTDDALVGGLFTGVV